MPSRLEIRRAFSKVNRGKLDCWRVPWIERKMAEEISGYRVLTLELHDLRDQRCRATAIQFLLSDKCSVFCHRAGVLDLLPAFQQQAENYRGRLLGFNDTNA